MASFAWGQDELNPAMPLLSRQDGDLTAVSRKWCMFFMPCHRSFLDPVKLVRTRGLDIGLIFFSRVYGPFRVSAHNEFQFQILSDMPKKHLCQNLTRGNLEGLLHCSICPYNIPPFHFEVVITAFWETFSNWFPKMYTYLLTGCLCKIRDHWFTSKIRYFS